LVTLFDAADTYGNGLSEELIAKAFPNQRDEIVVATKVGFSAFSNKSCTTRSFDRFSDANMEVIDSRVWSGIHFRTADTQGAVLGNKVAHYLDKHYFQPVQ
jgi:predicted oxidoreductase